jgi:hypothetical protein
MKRGHQKRFQITYDDMNPRQPFIYWRQSLFVLNACCQVKKLASGLSNEKKHVKNLTGIIKFHGKSAGNLVWMFGGFSHFKSVFTQTQLSSLGFKLGL